MYEILMIIYLVVALVLIGFILIQQGKGAGMGSSFGSGASGTVFGASGSGNFLTKTTTVLAIVFFGVALGLGNLTTEKTATPVSESLFPAEEAAKNSVIEKKSNDTGELPVEVETNSSDIPAVPVEVKKKSTEKTDSKKEEKAKDTDDNN